MSFSMKPSAAFFLAFVFVAGQRALAVNDWSVPCTQGKCSWDLPADSGASGTVHIWGPPSLISDITPATGWQITASCDPSTTTQDIQLVCKDNNPDCDHLFQGMGAVNTIVRLPDSCGPMPFARVAHHQILQSNLSSRANGPIHQLVLDTNFTAAGPSQDGDVSFSLLGTNTQGNSNVGKQARRSHRRLRSLSNSQNNIHRRNFITDGLNALRDGGAFNESISPNPFPVDFSAETNLFHTSIKCPIKAAIPITPSASVSLDVATNVHASISIGAVAAGTIIPPKITEFGLDFVLDGNVDAKFNVMANISGQVSSGSITLFQVGIPGLSIPGILDLGPEFKLLGRMDAKFELNNIKAVVDVNYDLNGASFVFPPQEGSNADGIIPSAKQVTITTSPDVGSTFEATAHLVPQIDVGLSALQGIESASVFLNLDASADFTASTTSIESPQPCVTASTDINVGVGAQGSFFGLFDASVGKSLFDKRFPLFQKCFKEVNSTSMAPPATVTLSDSKRHHDVPRVARHRALSGRSSLPRHAKRQDITLSCL